jgi:DNA replication protein DnaC
MYPKTKRYFNAIKKDKKFTKTKFEIFGKNIKKHISKLKKKIISINKSGKKIYCYGAPAKGNTLLNTMKVTNKLISKCVEVNKLKIGKYLPGSKIPIVDEYKIKNKPDVYFLLSHNFGKEILKKNKDQAFLIPFPKIRIIKC